MTIFVAGLSGQIGHAVVDHGATKVIGLVRRSTGTTRLRRRIESRSREIELVYGDITVPHWGLERGALEKLAAEVTCVVNCAGSTDWQGSAESLHVSNVVGAVYGVGFAARLAEISGRSVPYLHTSTTYVAGSAIGVVPETRLGAGADRTRYEHFKWMGEQAVLRQAADVGVPVLLARMPALLGDSHTGETLYKNSLYQLSERWNDIPLGLLPAMKNARVDCVPRNTAAQVLIALANGLAARSFPDIEIVHITNGVNAPTLRALLEAARMVDQHAFDKWLRVVPAGRDHVVNASALGERFGRLPAKWQNTLIGLRYIGLDRTFDRANLLSALDSLDKSAAAPAISIEAAARLTFGLHPARESVVSQKHRSLVRFGA